MVILIYYVTPTFQDIAQTLQETLTTLGISCQIVADIVVGQTENVYLLLGAHNPMIAMPTRYIIYQFEQKGSDWFGDSYISKLRGAEMIWDYSLINYRYLTKELGLRNVYYVPLGYSPCLAQTVEIPDKDIDLLFLGSFNTRRQMILDRLTQQYPNWRIKIECNVWGDERNKLIARSRIVLNLHYYPNAILETSRLSLLVSQGACVVSERSCDPILDRQYEKYVVMSSDIAESCRQILTGERMGPETATYRTEYPMTKSIPVDALRKMLVKEIIERPSDNLRQPFLMAESEDGDGAVLKLPADRDFVKVSLVTPTCNRAGLFQIALRNFRHFKYPAELLQWVIVDDSDESESRKLSELLPLADPRIKYIRLTGKTPLWHKRNICAQEASGETIIHMDDDDYYFPESIYAKVRLLQKYGEQGYQCVGSREIGVYHLKDNYSFIMKSRLLGEAGMAYYKAFWTARQFADRELKFGEGAHFLEGRTDQVVDFPYWFNLIALSHGQNWTGGLREISIESRSGQNFFSLWDLETQLFFIAIKKKL